MLETDNYRKHTAKNPIQQYLINNFFNTLLGEVIRLNPQSILDVGCGEGFTLEKFRDKGLGRKLVGIDYSESAITIGHRLHPELKLQQATIYNIPFKANSFDLVICNEVLEHLDHPEKALAEIERVTKSNCIISVPYEPWFMLANFLRRKNITRFGNDIEHIQHWTRSGINALVSRYFYVTVIKNPFPWTLLTANKRS